MYTYQITLVPLDGGEPVECFVSAPHMTAALLGAKEHKGHGTFYVQKAEQVDPDTLELPEGTEVVAVF